MRDGLTGASEDGRQPKSREAGPTPTRRCLGNQDCLQQSRDFSYSKLPLSESLILFFPSGIFVCFVRTIHTL
jgi:hypothetical protein